MRILIIKNNVTDNDTLEKGLALVVQNLSTINLPVEFGEYVLNKQLSSIPFSNDVNQHGYLVNPNDFTGVWNIGYEAICLVYDWTKISPQPTNPGDNGQSMQIPVQWYVTYPQVFAEFFLHELCHLFFSQTGRPDITHYYDLAYSDSRIRWYLHILTQFVNKTRKATIHRYPGKRETTGILTVINGNSSFTCKTLELPYLNNQPNVSSIPPGTYTCKWTFSPRLMKYTYEIQNVPKRSGIRIHSANYYYNLLGCIALGDSFVDLNGDGIADTANSKITVDTFNTFFGKQDFQLTII